MKTFRPPFPIPILRIDDFLLEADAQRIFDKCLDLKTAYTLGRVFDGPATTKVDLKYRRNDAVYFQDELSEVRDILKKKIWTAECREVWHEGYYIFDVINYATWHEIVISRYGDGEFYKKHRDTNMDRITSRFVTLVYYVNEKPRQNSGGSLIVWHGTDKIVIKPMHNLAIIFPSFALHEVEEVHMDTGCWEGGRFSINYWMGFHC